MKVSELYIKKYHQFEDFTLNLTYPEGHKLAGQPLNKVCFIGQSGTGKTTLLEILENFIIDIVCFGDEMGSFFMKDYGEIKIDFVSEDSSINSFVFEQPFSISPLKYYYQTVTILNKSWISFWEHNSDFKIIISSSEIPLKKTNFEKSGNTFNKEDSVVINIEHHSLGDYWQAVNSEVTAYRETLIKKSLEISQIAQKSNFNPDDIIKATENFRKWREETPNPIQDLADNYLDKIIGRFNLKVKTELDFEKKEDIETIKIQQKNGKEIPFEALSTGTKQVILTALPLYGLKPKDSIILFDEPERSLYPDIQTEIVDFYTSMAENSQFFFATHSPLVAASFEPWEIVELKFNEETGNVEQEFYYDKEKERHVDNYTIYPQYLTYDGILKRVFDIKKEPNELRTGELVKLATLESQLKHNNLSPEAKKEKFEEYKKLADQLDWDLK